MYSCRVYTIAESGKHMVSQNTLMLWCLWNPALYLLGKRIEKWTGTLDLVQWVYIFL